MCATHIFGPAVLGVETEMPRSKPCQDIGLHWSTDSVKLKKMINVLIFYQGNVGNNYVYLKIKEGNISRDISKKILSHVLSLHEYVLCLSFSLTWLSSPVS